MHVLRELLLRVPRVDTERRGDRRYLHLGWWQGEDDFGSYVEHRGSVAAGEALMRIYPKQNVGIVVMGNMMDYRPVKILEGVMQAWVNEGQ